MPETQEERNSKRMSRRWQTKTQAWQAWWDAVESRGRPTDTQVIAWIRSSFEVGFMEGCDHALQDEALLRLQDIRALIEKS